MSFTVAEIRKNLFSVFSSLLERRDEFLTNPASDFTRKKKISFEQTMLFPMIAGAGNVASELLDLFGEEELPLPSAMIQRRNQIKKEAFHELFYQFNKSIPKKKTFHGYQLVACDGTRLNLPYNPADLDTLVDNIDGRKGFNQLHLNALYDVMNDIFIDVELQRMQEMDERDAFCNFLDIHSDAEQKTIFIADRGYASFNIYAHAINNNQLFLIRMKENDAQSLCHNSKHWLDGSYVDENVIIHVGRRHKTTKCKYENYHCVRKGHRYDFIDYDSNMVDSFRLRILKFPISAGNFEYIVTNLPKELFPLATIKELYNLRWGEETAFRHLKYAGNMVHIHSIKSDFLIQEIYGKLTLYNFTAFMASVIGKERKRTDKYVYVLNRTQAQKICIRFLKGKLKDPVEQICRYLVPVRPGRKFDRNLRRQSADTLNYR